MKLFILYREKDSSQILLILFFFLTINKQERKKREKNNILILLLNQSYSKRRDIKKIFRRDCIISFNQDVKTWERKGS